MKFTPIIAITATLLFCGGCKLDTTTQPTTATATDGNAKVTAPTGDKTSYNLGYRIAQEMKRKGITLDMDAVLKGIQAQQNDAKGFCENPPQTAAAPSPAAPVLAGTAPPAPTPAPAPAGTPAAALAETPLTPVERDILASNATPMAAFKTKHAAGMAFLADNLNQPDIKTTASGLQYKITQQGSGVTPTLDSTVTLNYKGTGIDGQEFINTQRTHSPETMKVKDLLGGLQEAVLMLKEGGKGEFYLPSKLGYGKTHGPLGHQTLIYQIELLSVK